MKTYIKAYRYRVAGIAMTVLFSFIAVLSISVIFKSELNKISNQLERYHNSEYTVAYVLNYRLESDNEFIFADTDIQLYLDEVGTERLTVSCLMPQKNMDYSLEEFKGLNAINDGEVVLSQNVADRYDLKVGDTVYVQYPYSSDMFKACVSAISGTEYDYENPIIANDIGIVYVAYNEKYVESTNCKYILFAKESMAKELSEHPQILSGVINKSNSQEEVFSQGVHILIFEAVFLTAALIISFWFFFTKSFASLRRIYLKGAKHSVLIVVPVLECLIWWGIPCFLGTLFSKQIIPCNSEITRLFYMIPLLYIVFFVIAVWIYETVKAN